MIVKSTHKKGQNLAERFAEERLRLDIGQDELAKICGVSRNTISYYECGRSAPKVDALAAFMRAGADIHYILIGRREGEPQPVMLSPDEIEVVDGYRASDDPGKEQIRLYIGAVATHCVKMNTSPMYRKRIDRKDSE